MFDVINGGKPFPEYSVVLLTKKSSGVYISIQSYECRLCRKVQDEQTFIKYLLYIFFLFYNTNSLILPYKKFTK